MTTDSTPDTIADWLNRCFTDLASRLGRGETRKTYGRESEVGEVLQLLASPLARHPLLLGPRGVGKSAVALEVADRVRRGVGPAALRGFRLLATSPRQLLAGLPPGDSWREALPQLWERLRTQGPTLIVFHDAHEAAGLGNRNSFESDMASLLSNLFQTTGGDPVMRLVAEARPDRWSHLTTTRPGYAGLFVPFTLREPDRAALDALLDAATDDLEVEYGVTLSREARRQATELTQRYIVNAAFPGKALALLEETMAVRRAAPDGTSAPIERRDVIARFATQSGLPEVLLDEAQLWDEQAVRTHFQRRVLGQEVAVEAVMQRLSLLKAAINDPKRPLGVFLFMGPTGVGKTELAKALAAFLFGRDEQLVRINMADYSENWQFTQLFGDPDPDEPIEVQRGLLAMRLGDQPFTILLLDEFEKANANIFQRFLQLLDEGILTTGSGEAVDLRNSMIILTSNVAATLTQQGVLGFLRSAEAETLEQRVMRSVAEFFRPEFVNRIDQVVFFQPLSRAIVRQIATRQLEELFQREGIRRRAVTIELDESVIDWLVEQGYSEHFGARYLRRQIEKTISYPIARALVTRPVEPESLLRLTVRGGEVVANLLSPAEASSLAGVVLETGPERKPLTLDEVRAALPGLRQRVERAAEVHRLDELRTQRDALLAAMARPDFWNDPASSEVQMRTLGAVNARFELIDGLMRHLIEAEALLEASRGRAGLGNVPSLMRHFRAMTTDLSRAELDLYFRDAFDPLDSWVTITAGNEEGEAATAWATELASMYLAWAERHGFDAEVVEESIVPDEHTSYLASMLVRIRLRIGGHGAFALLRDESGVHRLVEGNADGERVVRQARIAVWPVVPAEPFPLSLTEVNLQGNAANGRGRFLKRLRARVYATHRPTGLTVEVVAPAAFHETEALAVELLRALVAVEAHRLISPPPTTVWGDVVRTYQRHREQGVRDLRTDTTIKSIRHVLSGRIDPLLRAALEQRARTDRATF